MKITKRVPQPYKETEISVLEEDGYYWCARSVYALEFKTHDGGEKEVRLVRVQFEDNVITHFVKSYSDDEPLRFTGHLSELESDMAELLERRGGYMDSRTKERFYEDFDKVMTALKEIRNFA